MAYNYVDQWVFLAETINSDAEFDACSTLTDAQLTYIGILKQETGYKVSKEEVERSSTSLELVLTQKLEIDLMVLTTMDATLRAKIDGVVESLVIVDSDDVTVSGSTITISGTPSGVLLVPCSLYIEDDIKMGTGKVSPIRITGSTIKQAKADLYKTITLSHAS